MRWKTSHAVFTDSVFQTPANLLCFHHRINWLLIVFSNILGGEIEGWEKSKTTEVVRLKVIG